MVLVTNKFISLDTKFHSTTLLDANVYGHRYMLLLRASYLMLKTSLNVQHLTCRTSDRLGYEVRKNFVESFCCY